MSEAIKNLKGLVWSDILDWAVLVAGVISLTTAVAATIVTHSAMADDRPDELTHLYLGETS